MYTRESILAKIEADQDWAERAILAIDARQTSDERAERSTRYHNGRGWNGIDAGFGGGLAAQIRNGRRLSERQLACGRKMIRKYAGQLLEVANG